MAQSQCKSSLGSLAECRLSAGWSSTLRPSQSTRAVSPPKTGCYHPQSPSPFVIITQSVSWYSFYRPTEDGRLNRPRHCSKGAQPMPKAVYGSGCRDKHNGLRSDSSLGPATPQSYALATGSLRPARKYPCSRFTRLKPTWHSAFPR